MGHKGPYRGFKRQQVLAHPGDPVAVVMLPLLERPLHLTTEHLHASFVGLPRDLAGGVGVLSPPHPTLEGPHLLAKASRVAAELDLRLEVSAEVKPTDLALL